MSVMVISVEESFQALVVILSIMLAIFLTLGIFVLVYVLKVIKNIRHITEKAEQIADRAESMSAMFEKTAPTVAVGRLVGNLMEMFKSNDKRGKK